MSDSRFEAAARVDELPNGTLLGVTVRGEPICLINANDEIFAISDVCTHAEFPMHEGFVTTGCRIECAWHGATFDLRNGSVIRPPADEPLPTYEVRVRDGVIEVGPRKRAAESVS